MRHTRSGAAMAALAAALLAPNAGHANDSTSALATGGLIFTVSPEIEMRSEELFISPSEVRVKYVFHNKSAKEAATLVAFPMPDLDARAENFDYYAIPVEDPANFVGFKTLVDGKPVTAQLEQTVFGVGLERTQALKDARIPLNPALPATWEALKKLSTQSRHDLRVAGLIDLEDTFKGDGKPDALEPRARWLLKTTFFWHQKFPPGRDVVVEHSYKPSVGITAGSPLATPGGPKTAPKPVELARYQERYCTDDAFAKAATALLKKGGAEAFLMEKRIDYTLMTGANWGGPIGSFTATIDTGSPDALVSFCAEDVKKISPTRFEIRKSNYLPSSNLSLLILEKPAMPAAGTTVPQQDD